MHLEVLVEDRSGSIALETILEKILGENHSEHSWRIHHYRGIGRIPRRRDKEPRGSLTAEVSSRPGTAAASSGSEPAMSP